MPGTETDQTESLVRRLDDERQIRNLIARVSHLTDYGDLDEYMTLFTDDTVWDFGEASREGATAIRADRVSRRDAGGQGPGSDTRHLNTTVWVEVDGSDLATAHSYFTFVRGAGTAPTVVMSGRYHDTLRRANGSWQIARREVHIQN